MYKSLTNILIEKRVLLVSFLTLQLIASVIGAFQPLYTQKFFSAIVQGLENYPQKYMVGIFLMMALIYFVSSTARGLSSYAMSIIITGVSKDVRIAFFSKMSRLPISYFRNENQGEFVSKFNEDLGNTERLLGRTIPHLILNSLKLITVLVILMLYCRMSLVIAGCLVAIMSALLLIVMNKTMARFAEAKRENRSQLNTIFDETVQGIDTLKIFVNEPIRLGKFKKVTDTLHGLGLKTGKINSVFSVMMSSVNQYGNLLILILIYLMISNKQLDTDSFLLFFFYLAFFQRAFSDLVGLFWDFQPTIVSLRRVDSLFSERGEHAEEFSDQQSTDIEGFEIEIANLFFSYPGGKTVFRDTNMYVADRQTALIEGPSGSGKTTLINLLLRFYEPTGGRILINGKGIDEYPLAVLRNGISVVTQDYFIFEEPLRDNLTIAKPEASDADLMDVIKKANLYEWYRTLPNGLDTVIGPRGKRISAGERQRLCIARAFLKGAPLLILDEPFANLDGNSKSEILGVIENLKHDITIIMISHQPIETELIDIHYSINSLDMKIVESDSPSRDQIRRLGGIRRAYLG